MSRRPRDGPSTCSMASRRQPQRTGKAHEGAPLRSTHSGTPRNIAKSLDDPRVRYALVFLVLALACLFRFVHLGADPALDVSWSQDLFTDPPQYTSYARNAHLFGDWNPLNDERLVFFLKNVTGFVAWLVFFITGPSVAAGQIVAVLLNLIGVACLAWVCGRAFGFVAGISTGFLLAIQYLFVHYGRLPFLEVASNALLAASLLALVLGIRTWWWSILAGALAGLSAFFGKVTALHAAPVFALATALAGFQAKEDSSVKRWGRPAGFAGGMLAIYIFWYLFAYMPASDAVLAYLKEQSLSLYGTPVGLTSIKGFLLQWFSFGTDTGILTWGVTLSILGFLGMALMLVHACIEGSWRDVLARIPVPAFAVVGWFWSAWAAFMPFNYRPVRYQIVLLYPLAAAAGWFVARLVSRPATDKPSRTAWYALPLLAILLATGLQNLVMPRLFDQRQAEMVSGIWLAVILGLLVAGGWIVWRRRLPGAENRRDRKAPRLGPVLAALALTVALVNQGRHFINWWSIAQHTIEDANRDLRAILSSDAIATGGYGTTLTQGGAIGNFPAMFGVSTPDTAFFARFPVTHVIDVDQPGQPFFKNYPEIAAQAARVASYTIRNLGISVFRVSGAGGNPQAARYVPSAFERKRAEMPSAPTDTLLAYLAGWVADSANHFSGWRWLGDAYFVRGDLPNALNAYSRAAEFFPSDFFLWAQIGDVSWEMFRTGSSSEYRDRAAQAWSRAAQFNPRNPQLMERLSRVNAR